MAAPTPAAALGTPAGITLKDGFSTAYVCDLLTTFSMWEVEADVMGWVGGEPIKTTNMRNVAYHTRYPRTLTDTTPISISCQYDPNALNQAKTSLLNKNGTWTCFLPDGTTIAFYGTLTEFKPQKVKEGDQPMAQATIVPTHWDPVNHVEAGPVITSVAGT